MWFELSLEPLVNASSPFVTDAGREALRIEMTEQLSPTGADASVQIPWDSVADRLAAADRFLTAYPEALQRQTIEDFRRRYLLIYLTGSDNTPAFEFRTRVLRPEVRMSFERFLQVHAHTSSAQIIRAYLDLLAKAGYRRTADVESFLRSSIPER
jgi:hypothetical protein